MKNFIIYFFAFFFYLISLKASDSPNILIITADDMNYNSVGVYGCPVKNTTPFLDKLSKEGMKFNNAHVGIAVCVPSRGVLMTGMYPHRSGIEGFLHYEGDKPTLTEVFREKGYLIAMMSKNAHTTPKEKELEMFDMNILAPELGRDPQAYYKHTKKFIKQAKAEKKPFFIVANSNDPHKKFTSGRVPPSKVFTPDEITVPPFLSDLPEVKQEIAEYYGAVRRFDDTVEKLIQAVKEEGVEENTLIIIFSDHGMPFPFAKTNVFLNSTKTPFFVIWKGVIKPNTTNDELLAVMDIMPTLLDIIGEPVLDHLDGKSFFPALQEKPYKGHDYIIAEFHETSGFKRYPMRAIMNKKYGYIFNPWSDGVREFKNDGQRGPSFQAMVKAAPANPDIKERVDMFTYRVVEEFYDLQNDPDALDNLIDNPKYKKILDKLQTELEEWMIRTEDTEILDAFRNRDNEEALKQFMVKQDQIAQQNRAIKRAKKMEAERKKQQEKEMSDKDIERQKKRQQQRKQNK